MKKRSLIVATAMLLVAILACSGATYAWFTRNPNATINKIEMGVQSASGLAISLNTEDADHLSNLDQELLASDTNNKIAPSLLDVSATKTGVRNGTFFKATTVNAEYEAEGYTGAAAGTDYTMVTFKLWNLDSTNAKTVKVVGNITNGEKCTAAKVARVGLYNGTDDPSIFGTSAKTYNAVSEQAGTTVETTSVAISSGNNAFVTIPANGSVVCTLCVWIEGTDAECTNAQVVFGNIDVDLTFTALSSSSSTSSN